VEGGHHGLILGINLTFTSRDLKEEEMSHSAYVTRSRNRFIKHKYEYRGNPSSPLGYLAEKLRKFRKCNKTINKSCLISPYSSVNDVFMMCHYAMLVVRLIW
jgi:hypothetical protein